MLETSVDQSEVRNEKHTSPNIECQTHYPTKSIFVFWIGILKIVGTSMFSRNLF